MSGLLKQAITELSKLSENQQDAMVQWILDELNDDVRWDTTFAKSQLQLEQLADEALADLLADKTDLLDPDALA